MQQMRERTYNDLNVTTNLLQHSINKFKSFNIKADKRIDNKFMKNYLSTLYKHLVIKSTEKH